MPQMVRMINNLVCISTYSASDGLPAGWTSLHNDDKATLATIASDDLRKVDIDGNGRIQSRTLDSIGISEVDDAKGKKITAIVNKTAGIIDTGFVYDSQVYSLTDKALRNITGLVLERDAGRLSEGVGTLPMNYPNIDNTFTLVLDDSNVDAFLLAAKSTYMVNAASGGPLVAQVQSATTVAEVDAVVDNR